MSGVYDRKLYDHCDLAAQDKISKGPGNYNLKSDPVSNLPSFSRLGSGLSSDTYYNRQNISSVGDFVDLESHLKRIDKGDSNCREGTLSDLNLKAKKIRNKLPKTTKMSDERLMSSYSRMENPAIDVRSMTTSRFDFPIIDPRNQIYYGTPGTNQIDDLRFGISTRLDARDSDPNDYMKKIEDLY